MLSPNQKIVQYRIIKTRDLDELETWVNQYVAIDATEHSRWIPMGGIVMSEGEFAQALIRINESGEEPRTLLTREERKQFKS